MQYNEKYYLYYTLKYNGFCESNASCIVDSLGKFELVPGTLREVKTKEDSRYIRGAVTEHFSFSDSPLLVDKFSFNSCGANIIYGHYLTGEKIKIAFVTRDGALDLSEVVFLGSDLFIGSSRYDIDTCGFEFDVDYYDSDTVNCLKNNYKYDDKVILEQDWSKLKEVGISPDSTNKSPLSNYISDLFHTFNAEDVIRELTTQLKEIKRTRE